MKWPKGIRKFPPISESIGKLDCPVITAINRDGVGGGLGWTLACDIRIAIETAHFGLPQIRYDSGTGIAIGG